MTEIKTILYRILMVTAILAVLTLAAYMGLKSGQSQCRSIQFVVEDSTTHYYLYPGELDSLLYAQEIHPVGKTIDDIPLHKIEKTVLNHPMVRTAECYLTPRREVIVTITQRTPLLRIDNTQDEDYFVDIDRKPMPIRGSVKDSVLLITGEIDKQLAVSTLVDITLWLQGNSFWSNHLASLELQGKEMLIAHLNDKNYPKVVLGSYDGFISKMNKIQIFLENSNEAIADKKYDELDARYQGQVIGRIKSSK